MTDPKLDAKLQEIAGRAWRHVSALERGIHDNGSPVILAALREAVEAATQEQTKHIVALHAKLQGAFALLSPEDSEELGITKEMVDCEDPACGLYEEHVRQAVEAAVAQEREAVRKQIDADCCRTYRCYHRMTAWFDARSRSEEPKG